MIHTINAIFLIVGSLGFVFAAASLITGALNKKDTKRSANSTKRNLVIYLQWFRFLMMLTRFMLTSLTA
jgi:hypothetical protein